MLAHVARVPQRRSTVLPPLEVKTQSPSRFFAALLIDCDEGGSSGAVRVGMLREADACIGERLAGACSTLPTTTSSQ